MQAAEVGAEVLVVRYKVQKGRVQRCWVCSTRCRVHGAGVQRCMGAWCSAAEVQGAEVHSAEPWLSPALPWPSRCVCTVGALP